MPIRDQIEQRAALQHIADVLRATPNSPLVWFSRSGSGDAIAPVTAAFLDVNAAMAWAVTNPSDTVHFPNGNQLQAHFAMADGRDEFIRRATRD
jgi:hypothetical protein